MSMNRGFLGYLQFCMHANEALIKSGICPGLIKEYLCLMSYGSIFLSVQSFYVAKLFRNVGKTGYNAALDTHSAFLLVPNRNFLVTRSLFEYSLVMMLSDLSISLLPRLQ